jgi:NAD(P) transhydrogenase subunit alpha
MGPTNLPATVPYHASQMYAKNITTFLLHLMKGGSLVVDTNDEITRETLVARDGEVVHPRVRPQIYADERR